MFHQKGYSVERYNIKQVLQCALLGRMTSDGFPRVIAKDRFSGSCFMMENAHTRAADETLPAEVRVFAFALPRELSSSGRRE